MKTGTTFGGVVGWLTRQISNLRIAVAAWVQTQSWTRNFTTIAQHWLVPGMDLRVFL